MHYAPIDQETLATSRISPAKMQKFVTAKDPLDGVDLYALMRHGRYERSAAFHNALAAIWQMVSPGTK